MCTKPCKECPYTKNAIPGYFGGHSQDDYRSYISQDAIVACHTRSKFDGNGDCTRVVPCIGHAVAQINSCKQPIPESPLDDLHHLVRTCADFEQMKQNGLSIFNFDQHHNGPLK